MENLINNFNKKMNIENPEHNDDLLDSFVMHLQPLQQDIVFKVLYLNSSIYLVDLCETNTQQTIKVLGNLTTKSSGSKRECYDITFNKNCGNFTCTCKDFIFRCSVKGLLCKHISFVVCKVLNIFDANFFTVKQMTVSQIDWISNKLKESHSWKDKDLSVKYVNSEFKENTYNLNKQENCPICLNAFNEDRVLSCPNCKQHIHRDCMKMWLEYNDTCIFCRSKIWRDFNHNFSNV